MAHVYYYAAPKNIKKKVKYNHFFKLQNKLTFSIFNNRLAFLNYEVIKIAAFLYKNLIH